MLIILLRVLTESSSFLQLLGKNERKAVIMDTVDRLDRLDITQLLVDRSRHKNSEIKFRWLIAIL